METLSGFHGTFVCCIDDILTKGFTATVRKDHWLGRGVYFYKDDLEQAKVWATLKRNRNIDYKDKLIAVLHSDIIVKTSEFLNLNLRQDVNKLIVFAQEILSSEDFCVVLDLSNPNINRCFLLDLMTAEKNINVILSPFFHLPKAVETLESELGYCLGILYCEQQICVKNADCISPPSCCHKETKSIPIMLKRRPRF